MSTGEASLSFVPFCLNNTFLRAVIRECGEGNSQGMQQPKSHTQSKISFPKETKRGSSTPSMAGQTYPEQKWTCLKWEDLYPPAQPLMTPTASILLLVTLKYLYFSNFFST